MKTKIPVCITLDGGIYKRYKEFCKKEGISLSRRLSILLEKDLNGNGKDGNNKEEKTTEEKITLGKPEIKIQETYLKEALKDFFMDNPNKEFSLKEIYSGIQDYIKIDDKLKEQDFLHPSRLKFHHLIDCHIQSLKKEGFLKHKSRNRWLHNPYE